MNTQDIKALLSPAITVAEIIDDTLANGVSFTEVFKILGVLKEVAPAIAAVKSGNLWNEYKSLTDADKADLVTWFDATFQIKEANIETVVEQAWAAIVGLGGLAQALKA